MKRFEPPSQDLVNMWRSNFPILARKQGGMPLVYLDNAATTQKPYGVVEVESNFYRTINANVHRGVHRLSQEATIAYEAARDAVKDFINASDRREIVFVRGTTEAINLVAQSYARPVLRSGDEIIVSGMEHHSNIVPWQFVCQQTGATLKVIPMDDAGVLHLDAFRALLSERTKLVAVTQVSNALGTVNPVREMIALAHSCGVPVLVDGAQAVAHTAVDVQALDCDFYAFSGHKMYGPTGIGVLYAKAALLEAMPPWQGGGDMIQSVGFDKVEFNELPYKFEAGTPNIAGAVGLAAAIDHLSEVGMRLIEAHEADLLRYATARVGELEGVRIIGTAPRKAGVLSFVVVGVHAHDVGTILDDCGIAVRAGHHCAMPVMDRFGIAATVRASIAMYNTADEIDALVAGISNVMEIFSS